MNVLITGSRTITDKDRIFGVLDKEIKEGDVIIHGGARGVDSTIQFYCGERNIPCVCTKPIYPCKKEYYLYRNAEMVGMCDRVIAFWDGESRGTKFTIDYAKSRRLDVRIFTMTETPN